MLDCLGITDIAECGVLRGQTRTQPVECKVQPIRKQGQENTEGTFKYTEDKTTVTVHPEGLVDVGDVYF